MIAKRMPFLACVLSGALFLSAGATEAQSVTNPEDSLVMMIGYDYEADIATETPGASEQVVMALLPDLAPRHVARISELADSGFYDGAPFHRVIEGFMAQTGDPVRQNGTGGSSLPDLEAEFSQEPFVRGVVGMARAQSPNSANSQFFIMFEAAPSLDGQYTVFGRVTDGMEHVDRIKRGPRAQNGVVTGPRDRILWVRTQQHLDAEGAPG